MKSQVKLLIDGKFVAGEGFEEAIVGGATVSAYEQWDIRELSSEMHDNSCL